MNLVRLPESSRTSVTRIFIPEGWRKLAGGKAALAAAAPGSAQIEDRALKGRWKRSPGFAFVSGWFWRFLLIF